MTTDTHAALLAELPEEFKPADRPYVLSYNFFGDDYLYRWAYGTKSYGQDGQILSTKDAHAHIERAAWKRVRAFLRTSTGDTHMAVTEYKGTITIDDGCDLIIGQGPDDATALLAACRFINEKEKR